jgi:molecular chaperone DnaK
LPAAPRGVPQIEVTFDIDANGILSVSAKDLGTGREQKIRVEATTTLDKSDIERMVKEAELNASADKQRREQVEARNGLDSMIFTVEKTIKDNESAVPADMKSEIQAAIEAAKSKLNSTNVEELQAARKDLEQKSHKLAELIYKNAAAGQGASGSADKSSTAKDPNVVDAEFEEGPNA